MCGIALVLSGVRLFGPDFFRERAGASLPDADEVCEPVLTIGDLEAALLRRGPDSLGCRKVFLKVKQINNAERPTNISVSLESKISIESYHVEHKEEDLCLRFENNEENYTSPSLEAAGAGEVGILQMRFAAELDFIGATLQLRGVSPVFQPLVDTSGNLLVYNGEVFGGVNVDGDSNDAETLLHALERSCSCLCHELGNACSCIEYGEASVPEILSTIKGPWALIYWEEKSKTIWFGRDAFGRRSLLVHWPTSDDSRFVLSSVSPLSSIGEAGSTLAADDVEPQSDLDVADMSLKFCYWEELPCGIYSVKLEPEKPEKPNDQYVEEKFVGKFRKHDWTESMLNKLIKWERTYQDPRVEELSHHGHALEREESAVPSNISKGVHSSTADLKNYMLNQAKLLSEKDPEYSSLSAGYIHPAQKVLIALKESVSRRTNMTKILQPALHQGREQEPAPIAVLFSGGLDSMILAALLDQCLNPSYAIELLNVSFDGQLAPDRVSARAGIRELQRIAPLRRWRLVEIDASLSNLTWETKHVMSLIHPAKTYMDLNIGIALWLAAGGDGWVDGQLCNIQGVLNRYKYKSTARILLVGSGADEQCAGYGRHRTKYRLGGWIALQEEMRLDVQRIWKRNMGRDDRCISDRGKEARFPFLDEDVIKTLLDIPLWEIAELDEPAGRGDKKILREVARLLDLDGAAVLPKRAIQFGSRIARESNRKNFGSNRAANQASAGSVEICQVQTNTIKPCVSASDN